MTREIVGRTFTFTEFRETFFPNMTMEELEGEPTEEQTREDLRRIVEIARQNSARSNSKKVPRKS